MTRTFKSRHYQVLRLMLRRRTQDVRSWEEKLISSILF